MNTTLVISHLQTLQINPDSFIYFLQILNYRFIYIYFQSVNSIPQAETKLKNEDQT